ncbi:MAG: hypothetical protein ACYDD1_07180 [Caulobacteraceae bacterium]
MSVSPNPSEHRIATRRRVLLTGKLAYGDGFSTDCRIREQSETGARIVVSADLLPREVVLICVTAAMAYEAEIMWRRGKEAGLKLGRSYPLKAETATSEDLPRVQLARKLWAETLAR